MAESLKILNMTAELTPLASTGGLGDVAHALPRALRAQGHDVRVVMPCYDVIPPAHRGEQHCMCVVPFDTGTEYGALRVATVPDSDVPLYLIEHDAFFARGDLYGFGGYEYEDNAARFCFFSLAALDGVPQLDWKPDIIHCHDWHTAAVPAYLKTRPLREPSWWSLPTLLTIHNLNYQGRYPAWQLPRTGVDPMLFTSDAMEYYGDINLLKLGIRFSTKLNTVSPRYAREIQTPELGAGLDGILRDRKRDLHGILNGVDYELWNPATDRHIPFNYSIRDMSGKRRCKQALQKKLGLPKRDVPLFAMITRLSWQKGVDIVPHVLDMLPDEDIQVVVLGNGDPFYKNMLHDLAVSYPDKVKLELKFDLPLSHQLEAGADFILMPSRYEPCGLSQMYSMAYGTIPVVHKTGGLADTVKTVTPYNIDKGRATGFPFAPCEPAPMARAVRRAIKLYKDRPRLQLIRDICMKQDFSWSSAADAYVRLYDAAREKTATGD